MKIKELKDKWDYFFFKERPIHLAGLFRILFGSLVLIVFFQDALYMNDLWGPNSIQSLETSLKNYNFKILNVFQYFEDSSTIIFIFTNLLIISLICFIFGFKTKFFGILAFILLVSFNQRTINMLSSADLLIRILFMLTLFSPCEKIFSIDAYLRKKQGRPYKEMGSMWAFRLIQIQIAVVYVSTVIAKGGGETWIDGSAIYYATRLEEFTRFPVPFLLDSKLMIKLMTWSTLILEFALGTLIFIKEFRKPLIIIGIIFHLGIEYMMSIPTFEWLMIICLIAMFRIEDYKEFYDNRFEIKSKLLKKLNGKK